MYRLWNVVLIMNSLISLFWPFTTLKFLLTYFQRHWFLIKTILAPCVPLDRYSVQEGRSMPDKRTALAVGKTRFQISTPVLVGEPRCLILLSLSRACWVLGWEAPVCLIPQRPSFLLFLASEKPLSRNSPTSPPYSNLIFLLLFFSFSISWLLLSPNFDHILPFCSRQVPVDFLVSEGVVEAGTGYNRICKKERVVKEHIPSVRRATAEWNCSRQL